MLQSTFALFTLVLASSSALIRAQEKPTFNITNLPDKWEDGQYGSNQCGKWKPHSQRSRCQNVYVNSVQDFCLWGPPRGQEEIGEVEDRTVSYCTKSGYGTRIFPPGTLKGAHFIKTKDFVQVTGYGDFTSIHVKAGDEGGELDAHGADGRGNPHGGLVFTRNAKGYEGKWIQSKEWSNFMSATEFSIRACYGGNATNYCPHILDTTGSRFNHPGNYDLGYYDNCEAESGQFPLIYNGKPFQQGDKPIPKAHKPGRRFNCRRVSPPKSLPARKFPYRRSMDDDETEFEDAE
ncbi:uncharacterized protein FA14DRAFT_183227 [Meira miltonrushii]|uniref:Uncharacterized protein n=1 Tax=Meira miltonrushii TaxID=1280837 RepID=A0A316VIH6_9BASI|nr:uncharacterized protein FA14DRAFT_183227 [Meira miltonrushii]PWN36848.1 hypothetical protein FA14DRAFT_183227 [Meira miltonrushii]